MHLSRHSFLLLTSEFSCCVSSCCPPSSKIKNERHSVEYQSIPKKGVAHSDSVILLLVSLVILEFLVLLALAARVTAAENEEANGAAHKEDSSESEYQRDDNLHEETVFKLISVLLLGSLELLGPGIVSHADWFLKL